MALLANLHRDPKRSAPAKPDDFHPFRHRKNAPSASKPNAPLADISILKTVFVDRCPLEG
jgi:hypothetical protein